MGRPVIDLTGKKFNHLTVLYLCDYDNIKKDGTKEKVWHCKCDCGKELDVVGNLLKYGKKSCGCKNKQKNIDGMTFGNLTVKSSYKKMMPKSAPRTRCICQCSCGKEVDVNYHDLVNNKKTSCGCMKSNERPNRIRDLTGQKFNRFTVIERDLNKYYTSGGKRLYKWVCRCECGTIVSVERQALVSGHIKSCGCLYAEKNSLTMEEYKKGMANRNITGFKIDLTGKKFGKLTAIKPINEKHKKTKWLCECDCGGQAIVQTSNLTNGHTQSCGCIDSVGEMKISQILLKNGLNFKKEITFEDCRDKHPLPFDFGIYDKDDKLLCIIEYDGKQHFEPIRFNGMTPERAKEAFEIGQIHDKQKNNYCTDKNIPLLRIKYTQIDMLDKIVEHFLMENSILLEKCG